MTRCLTVSRICRFYGFCGSGCAFYAKVMDLTLKVVVLTLKVMALTLTVVALTLKVEVLTPKVMFLTTGEEQIVSLTTDD